MSELRCPQINQVALAGVLVQEPELERADSGRMLVRFSITVTRRYCERSGGWGQDTICVPVVVWDRLAEFCAERLRQGSGVFITGRLTSRKDATGDGNRSALEVAARSVQFLSRREEEETAEEEMPF